MLKKSLHAMSPEPGKLKAFISYSRTEVRFADELELFLQNSGFESLIDRHGIDAGEDWKSRLGDLLSSCDTVVFVLSDTSAASSICRWEVAEAARLMKRMLVVTMGPVAPGIAPPPQLAGINWISCWANPTIPGSNQTKGFFELQEALRTDLHWVRRLIVLQGQARRWEARGSGADSPHLLRDEQVAEALEWSRTAPAGEQVPENVGRYIAASEEHERRLQSKALQQARAVRRVSLGFGGVAALFLLAAIWLGIVALQKGDLADRQTARAIAQSSQIIAETSARMGDDAGLEPQALLMALYADAAATSPNVPRKYAPKEGNLLARDQLMAAHEAMRLQRIIIDPSGPIWSAKFSPDGAHIVTVSSNNHNASRVWQASTGKLLSTEAVHPDPRANSRLLPNPTGERAIAV